jgi:hypothetical protein
VLVCEACYNVLVIIITKRDEALKIEGSYPRESYTLKSVRSNNDRGEMITR